MADVKAIVLAACAAGLCLLGTAQSALAQAKSAKEKAAVVEVETVRQVKLGEELPLLFVDDSGVAAKSGVERTLHKAETRKEPVLESERDKERVYIYGSAYADPENGPDAVRMWFMTVAPPGTGKGTQVRYAQSKDGVTWPKLMDCKVVFAVSSPGVLIDAFEKDPAKKYKLIGGKKEYKMAYSGDGINWTQYEGTKEAGGDTLTITQDPYTGEYLCYHKRERIVRGKNRRVVAVMRSTNFVEWGNPKVVLVPDEEDDAFVKEPEQSMQIYNMSVFPHAGGFVGMALMFQLTDVADKKGAGQSRQDGPIDVQMVTSKNGNDWERSVPRMAMIPRGEPGSFDAGAILALSTSLVNTAQHTCVYYTGITTGHGGAMPAKQLSIGLAQWRRHGFASLDAKESGRVETVAVMLEGPRLVVNADAGKGELRVGLLEADGRAIPGYSVEDCVPLKVDATAWTAEWKGKKSAPTDRPVKVVVEMKGASLFSLSSGAGK